MENNFLIGIGVWNCIVFLIYGLDKWLAIQDKQRISEFTFIFLAFAFSGVGALVGMALWRHKTLKWKFRILIPIAFLWQVFAMGYRYALLS